MQNKTPYFFKKRRANYLSYFITFLKHLYHNKKYQYVVLISYCDICCYLYTLTDVSVILFIINFKFLLRESFISSFNSLNIFTI